MEREKRDGGILTSEHVREIYSDCLFRQGEDPHDLVIVDGFEHYQYFNPDRLGNYCTEIDAMLDELPANFREDSPTYGGPFHGAKYDSIGRLWAESTRDVEYLVSLGIAIGRVTYCYSPESWEPSCTPPPFYIKMPEGGYILKIERFIKAVPNRYSHWT